MILSMIIHSLYHSAIWYPDISLSHTCVRTQWLFESVQFGSTMKTNNHSWYIRTYVGDNDAWKKFELSIRRALNIRTYVGMKRLLVFLSFFLFFCHSAIRLPQFDIRTPITYVYVAYVRTQFAFLERIFIRRASYVRTYKEFWSIWLTVRKKSEPS